MLIKRGMGGVTRIHTGFELDLEVDTVVEVFSGSITAFSLSPVRLRRLRVALPLELLPAA